MLIAGGSGVVPLMSMLRTRNKASNRAPGRLLYSSRRFEEIIYREELGRFAASKDGFSFVHTLTRGAPADWQGETRRVDPEILANHPLPPPQRPQIFVFVPPSFFDSMP